MTNALFTIRGCRAGMGAWIPWSALEQRQRRVIENHGRPLAELNRSGGLAWHEVLAVLEDRPCRYVPYSEARQRVEELLRE